MNLFQILPYFAGKPLVRKSYNVSSCLQSQNTETLPTQVVLWNPVPFASRPVGSEATTGTTSDPCLVFPPVLLGKTASGVLGCS
jgi:hypothetical protein